MQRLCQIGAQVLVTEIDPVCALQTGPSDFQVVVLKFIVPKFIGNEIDISTAAKAMKAMNAMRATTVVKAINDDATNAADGDEFLVAKVENIKQQTNRLLCSDELVSRRLALSTTTDQPTEEQTSELKESFSLLDKDGDGTATAKELGIIVKALEEDPTGPELQGVLNEIDADENGTTDSSELLPLSVRQQHLQQVQQAQQQPFQQPL